MHTTLQEAMQKHIEFFFVVLLLIVAIIFTRNMKVSFHFKGDDITPKPTTLPTSVQTTPTPPTLANPASVNCQKVGGILHIQKDGAGNEYGLCDFGDNMACEEWALLRGECPVGGIKTTGFDAIEQKYCTWLGGKTFAQANAKCTFSDNSACNDLALYNGKCHKGQ